MSWLKTLAIPFIAVCISRASYAQAPVPTQTVSNPRGDSHQTPASDIYPDSRNRLPLIKWEDLDGPRKKQYDLIASDPAQLTWLDAAAQIKLHGGGEDVRYESPLGHRLTELAIISTAREMDQPFEWTLHAEEALRQGLER